VEYQDLEEIYRIHDSQLGTLYELINTPQKTTNIPTLHVLTVIFMRYMLLPSNMALSRLANNGDSSFSMFVGSLCIQFGPVTRILAGMVAMPCVGIIKKESTDMAFIDNYV